MSEQQATVVPPRRLRSGHIAIAGAVILAAAALTVAAARDAASGAPTAPACGGSTPRLTVQGTGQASGSPDSLDFDAQVSVTGSSAQGALAQDNATTSSVVQAMEATGVKSSDIQTTDLTINPNYTFINGRSVINGYGVANSLAVTVRNLGDAGTVIDAATTAGGNALSVGSLTFAQTDPRILEDRARRGVLAHRPIEPGPGHPRPPGVRGLERRSRGAPRGRDPAGERPGLLGVRARATTPLRLRLLSPRAGGR